jgi:hypothetical protein
MRRYARRAVAALAITVALAVTGCVATPGGTKPTPSPSATPLFQSDEEALAAAEEAYAAYLRVSDQILMDGGKKPERLLEVATEEVLANEESGYEKAKAMGLRSTGGSSFDQMRFQSVDDRSLSVYLCKDVSRVDILDVNGQSVVPSNRPDRYPLAVEFQSVHGRPNIVVSNVSDWEGENFCG